MRVLNLELEVKEEIKEYQFKGYSINELPSKVGPCVFMFSKFDFNAHQWNHHYLSNTSLFFATFPIKDFNEFLNKYEANYVFIYEEFNEELLLPIERAVREELNVLYKFEKL